MKKIITAKLKTLKKFDENDDNNPNQHTQQLSKNHIDSPEDKNHNETKDKNIETKDDENDKNDQNQQQSSINNDHKKTKIELSKQKMM